MFNDYAVFDFESFIPSDGNPQPDIRIMDYIVAGPFVLKTNGSFEYEHLYGRDKLLLEDYLAPDGGEKNIKPHLGERVRNKYYGPEYYEWQTGFIKWNSLRFDREDKACDDALFATEQRNAVYYVAFYVDCKKEEKAVISYINSGSSLFLNGELVDFKPFGRVKGLDTLGYQCPVTFKEGRNLILFKIRPGYIADTMDISMATCCVYPVILENDGVCISAPLRTMAYVGTKEKPEQVFPIFAFAEKDTGSFSISVPDGKAECDGLKEGECTVLRLGVCSTGKPELRKVPVILETEIGTNEGFAFFNTVPYDGFEGTEHIMSDFHFDTTYHQEQRTYALGAFHITKSIVENLEENPDFKAVLSEIDYLHPYYTLYPQHRKAIKAAFENGRAEADCFYNQANDLTSSGEAFVRNLIYGQLYHRDVLGRISEVYVPGDVFGHFSQISQVCAKGGCKMVRWGKTVWGLDRMFRHISPDGTVMIHDKGIIRPDAIRFGVSGCQHSSEGCSYIEAIPRQGDTDWMKNTVSNARFSVFSALAEDINESDRKNIESGKEKLIDYTSRDLTRHHSGVLLTRTDFKQANRLCENLLVSAEKFASIAFMYGAEYPDKAFDKAWRQLLTAQHHDSITGTNNEISFADLMIEYRECAFIAADILGRSAKYISSLVKDVKSDNSILVFNPVPSEIYGPCEFEIPENFRGKSIELLDANGKAYPVISNGNRGLFISGKVPGVGYSVYTIREKSSAEAVSCSTDCTIENEYFKLSVDKVRGGGICSITDKSCGKELIDTSAPSLGNAVYAIREIHDRMETQHEIYTTGQKLVSDEFTADVKSEKCALYEKLIVRTKLDTLAVAVREITLYRGSNKIDFKTVIEDYNGEDDLFTVAFPMNVKGGAVIFDDRFAPHVSTKSNRYMSFQTHQYASYSGCSVLPSNRWFGIGPSVTLKFADKGSVNIGMTALITNKDDRLYESEKKLMTAFSKKAVPVTSYPDREQHGGEKVIHFNEDIYQTDTRFVLSLSDNPDLYTEKLLSGLNTETANEIKTTIEKHGTVSVFLRDNENLWNKPIDVILIIGKDEAHLGAEIERLCAPLLKSYTAVLENCITADEPGFAENYGAEIINNGNIACSVEGKSTLNLMLFHTASFYGNAGKVTSGKELVPEDKTHIFTYELYPHKGSYREADTYGKAAEFNEKLFAVNGVDSSSDAFLAKEKGFLSSDPGFEITAFKAGGNPYAALRTDKRQATERGFTVRGFETFGEDTPLKLKFGFDVKAAESCNLLEEDTKEGIKTEVTAHSIETFVVKPDISEQFKPDYPVTIGINKELNEPTYVRSWEHDMGAVAMGYLSFAATLDKKPVRDEGKSAVININAVNNSADEKADVVISVSCSAGLSADRDTVTVSLMPGESDVIPIEITKAEANIDGQVHIYYEYDGQQFTDVYEFGYFNPEIKAEINGNKLVCTVVNPTDQRLDASVHIASPIETWGSECMNPVSFGSITPLSIGVVLEPHSEKKLKFDINLPDEGYFKAYYAAIKLCCNGRIHFAFADVHGPRHNMWSHEFISEIYKANGSIEKLLKFGRQ